MNAENFFIKVAEMRNAQKEYFAIAMQLKSASAEKKAIIKEQSLKELLQEIYDFIFT
jgi:hypothetical protein